MSASRSTHQSLQRAVAILRTFTEQTPSLTVGEISRITGIHKSTVSRILATLLDEGLVRHDPSAGRYSVGVGLVELAGVALGQIDVRGAAMPVMEQLARTVDETVVLCVLRGTDAVTVAHAAGTHSVRHVVWIGRRIPLRTTAPGKVFLAHAPSDSLDEGGPDLTGELARVREDGVAFETDEFEVGTSSIAVPVRDGTGAVVAALSVGAPTERMGPSVRETVVAALRDAADRISWDLGPRTEASA